MIKLDSLNFEVPTKYYFNVKVPFVMLELTVQIMTQRREAISMAQLGPEGTRLKASKRGAGEKSDQRLLLSACVVHTPALGCKSAF